MEDAEMSLVVRFHDPSPSYAAGFEVGRLWCWMEERRDEITGDGLPFRSANLPTIEEMAAHHGYEVERGAEHDGGWVSLVMRRLPPKPAPKLRLIDGGLSAPAQPEEAP